MRDYRICYFEIGQPKYEIRNRKMPSTIILYIRVNTFKSNYASYKFSLSSIVISWLLDGNRVKNKGGAQCHKGIALSLILIINPMSLSQFLGEMQIYIDNVDEYKRNY